MKTEHKNTALKRGQGVEEDALWRGVCADFKTLARHTADCERMARRHGKEKLLSEIATLRRRMDKIDALLRRFNLCVPSRGGETGGMGKTKCEDIIRGETRMRELIGLCAGTVDGLTCSNKEMDAVGGYNRVQKYLREFEGLFNARARLLRINAAGD